MEGTYDIRLAGQTVGQARVHREGLYYYFSCKCGFTGEVMYKITVSCGDRTELLGTPVPENGSFLLNTRIPVKRFGQGRPVFYAVPRHTKLQGNFIPICPEEPFAYLNRLKNAHLERRNGQLGVVLKE